MLSLAKAESKKEMNLKKHKFFNDYAIPQNKDSPDRNNLYQNYKESNCKNQNKKFKKTNIKDKNKISQKDPNLNADSSILPKNKYYMNLKKNQHSPLSSAKKRPLKKIVRVKNSPFTIREENKEEEKNLSNDKKLNKKIFNKKKRLETDNEINNILKTTKSGRIRKLFSMSSNIFNLNKTATNYMNNYYSSENPLYYKTIYKKNIDDNLENNSIFPFENDIKNKNDNNKNNNNNDIKNNKIPNKIKKKNINKKDITNNIKPNTILGISEYYPKKEKYNKINILNRTQYNIRDTNSLTSKNKDTNLSNIESVKYDIITNRKSNLFDKYNNLSGIKATSSNIKDYEILVPQNYNNSDINSLKYVLASNGVHVFGVKEEGDIISGLKGKYKLKIRIDEPDEKHTNKMINKSSKKMTKYDVELKRNHTDFRKRRTDVTGSGWDRSIKYGLY